MCGTTTIVFGNRWAVPQNVVFQTSHMIFMIKNATLSARWLRRRTSCYLSCSNRNARFTSSAPSCGDIVLQPFASSNNVICQEGICITMEAKCTWRRRITAVLAQREISIVICLALYGLMIDCLTSWHDFTHQKGKRYKTELVCWPYSICLFPAVFAVFESFAFWESSNQSLRLSATLGEKAFWDPNTT